MVFSTSTQRFWSSSTCDFLQQTHLEGCFGVFYCLFLWFFFHPSFFFFLSVRYIIKKNNNQRNRVLLDVILLVTRAFLNTSCSRNFLHVCLALQCFSLCYCWKPVPSLKIHLSSLEIHVFNFFIFFISVVLSFCQDEAQSPLTYCILGSQMLGLFQSFHSLELWQMLISVTGSRRAGAVQGKTPNAQSNILLNSASLYDFLNHFSIKTLKTYKKARLKSSCGESGPYIH